MHMEASVGISSQDECVLQSLLKMNVRKASYYTKSQVTLNELHVFIEMKGPVDKLIALKAGNDSSISGGFNQPSTATLSPSRISISESSLLQNSYTKFYLRLGWW